MPLLEVEDVVVQFGGVTALQFDPLTGASSFKVTNVGVGTAQFSAYSLLGTSPDAPQGGRGGEPDHKFIKVLHETAEYLAGDANVKVVSFEDVADGRVPIS